MVNKKAAIEMSMTTIVVVVLAMSMLILGMVLTRNIMCGAMGLTSDINTKVTSQINKLFTESGGDIEVHCLGEGTDQPIMAIGQPSFIMCTIKSNNGGTYTIDYDYALKNKDTLAEITTGVQPTFSLLGKGTNNNQFTVPASMERPTKVLQVSLNPGTPTGLLSITLTIMPPGETSCSSTNTRCYDISLDFKTQQISGLQNTLC